MLKHKFKVVRLKNLIIPFILILIIFFTIIFSKKIFIEAQGAFMLWVNNVIPSLLPFFICIELLKETPIFYCLGKLLTPIMKPLFNVPGCGALALCMGMASGYPVGAKVASELYAHNECSKIEAERLIAFTNSSGPMFIIGAVGTGMFGDEKIGLLLLITHFLASITVRNYF